MNLFQSMLTFLTLLQYISVNKSKEYNFLTPKTKIIMKRIPLEIQAYRTYSKMDVIVNSDDSLHCSLKRSFKSKDGKQNFEYHIDHSRHSRSRAGQRAMDYKTLLLILDYGTPFFRQGMVFYTVLIKDLPKEISPALKQKMKNLVVVVGSKGKQIVTCYHNNNSVKYLRKKRKELYKNRKAS